MSRLQECLNEYLEMRRALGYKLRLAGALLHQLVRFAEREGAGFLTVDLALRWARSPARAHPAQWGNRLGMARRFAQYCRATEPRTEIPQQQFLTGRYPRRPPYLYSEEEIDRLLQAARRLPSPNGLRAATYETYLGLLVVTGMRMNEAIRLDREDVDLSLGVLHVCGAKLGKSREIPIHPSTREALARYQSRRDRIYPEPQTSSFLLAETGARLGEFSVRATFIKLSHQIGLRSPGDRQGPRLHDFRHRFAVQTLLRWYRSGVDAERCLPKLATYLGHVHVQDTYWYLTAVPELLHWASLRLEAMPESSRP